MLEVLFHDRARKSLERLDKKTRNRIVHALERASISPKQDPNVAPLRGELSGLHRLRVGDYRVVIELDTAQGYLLVHAIGPRGDVYK
jgi:mRNA interferase RelE/StbE